MIELSLLTEKDVCRHPHDIGAYSEGKTAFINSTIAKAQSWRLRQEKDQ